MEMDYKVFSKKSNKEKLLILEDWMHNAHIETLESEKKTKGFLRDVIEKESNIYLRKISIEILSFLTVIEKVRKSSTIDILLDIENTDTQQIIVTALKYLYVFYNDEEDIVEKFQIFKESLQADVSSEAYFRLGLIRLLNNKKFDNSLDYINCLEQSGKLFRASFGLVENRNDAEYFFEVTKYLKAIICVDQKNADIALAKLNNIFFMRSAFSYHNESLKLENKIYDVLLNVYRIFQSSNYHEKWIDYTSEFSDLAQYHMEFINISISSNETQKQLIENFKQSIDAQILKNMYIRNFTYYETKINNIKNKYPEDQTLNEFLDIVKQAISEKEKKNSDSQYLKVCLQIKEVLPEVEVKDLVSKLKDIKDINNIEEVLKLIKSYTQLKHESNIEVFTGDATGEEIYFDILSSIKSALPHYNEQKLNVFMRILEETIRYLILTVKSKRTEDFKFLYTERHGGKGDKISERDFQDNLFKHYLYSKIAYLAEEEIDNFADGGRIDIVFKLNKFTFPVELKKTKKPISKDSIKEKYLEQLHTYTYAYDQLGIFAVLDLNDKSSPVNDVRELVYLDNIKPLYEVEGKYPDFIVVIIIPGNKPLPSDKSVYN